jgi:hypothetical protein
MNTHRRPIHTILAVLLFGTIAIGCSSSGRPVLGSTYQGDIVAYDIRELPDTINVDDNIQAHAIAIFDDGTEVDFTNGVSWLTSDSNVAALDPLTPGMVIGVSGGAATITVDDGTITGMKDITVNEPL